MIKTGLKSTWRNEKAKSMTCNLSKFILVLEHLKGIKVILILNALQLENSPINAFRRGEHFKIFSLTFAIFTADYIYKIKLNLSISNKCNYDVILSEKRFKRWVKLSLYCVWLSIAFKMSDLTLFLH